MFNQRTPHRAISGSPLKKKISHRRRRRRRGGKNKEEEGQEKEEEEEEDEWGKIKEEEEEEQEVEEEEKEVDVCGTLWKVDNRQETADQTSCDRESNSVAFTTSGKC